ncbi:hypothetical protein AAV35_008695 [Salimicrobium jeotgali]|uniref:Carnitine transport ATP-binding protein OpuCA n=2 Tax=Salimicrobium jeotgali TaxID=1230341 RepID=K2GB21_9BACI|nr:hypothetical protein AAV35_008695 [Salimicrobium jeotgali]EKE31537.1 ferric transporter ATP-binding subunit [Salimicrobium jeotgali]MBM7696355.1 iron(III) transport system ATP-binding protein/sulfate transport system ATP-binding protein/putative spermidine/putrescine transport system ATP-binding protein [Salimicrobium jeotgali]
MNKMIEVRDATKHFGVGEVLKDVSFSVNEGEIFSVVGPSGGGKTTLLRCLAGLETFSAGEMSIDGDDMTHKKANERPVSLVFQEPLLFPHMTIRENVGYGLKFLDISKKEKSKRIDDFLSIAGLPEYENRYPRELSGGQKQRVALARGLILSPKLLLLDEPFSSLDRKLREEMRRWVRRLLKEKNITAVFVTHDQDDAMQVGDVIGVFREGTFEQIGSPEKVYENPQTSEVARFFGDAWVIDEMRFIPKRNLSIERIEIEEKVQWRGVIEGVRFVKGYRFMEVLLDDEEEHIMFPAPEDFHTGENVYVSTDASNIRTFQQNREKR